MASTMMHLYAAREAARLASFQGDAAQYYLGAIAPDSVNVDGFADKQTRWRAHQRQEHIPDWYRSVAAFYRRSDRGDLALGYCVHCMTDAAYDLLFGDLVWEGRKASALEDVHGVGVGWDDCYRFDFEQRDASWWTQEVRPLLKAARPADGGPGPAELLGRCQAEVLQRYLQGRRAGDPLVVSAHLVEALGREVYLLLREHGIGVKA